MLIRGPFSKPFVPTHLHKGVVTLLGCFLFFFATVLLLVPRQLLLSFGRSGSVKGGRGGLPCGNWQIAELCSARIARARERSGTFSRVAKARAVNHSTFVRRIPFFFLKSGDVFSLPPQFFPRVSLISRARALPGSLIYSRGVIWCEREWSRVYSVHAARDLFVLACCL